MAMLEIKAGIREKTGAGSARNLIRIGRIPAVLYGNKQENINISLEAKLMDKLFRSGCFTSTVINLELNGHIHKAIVKEFQLDPVKDTLRHIDLILINSDQQKVDIPINFESKDKCLGVKRGGFFNTIHRKIKLICDPNKIPEKVLANVLEMKIGDKLLANQLILPEGSQLAGKAGQIIATITGRGKGGSDDDNTKKAATSK